MGSKLAGTCFIKVDGEQLELQGNLEFPLNKVTRETLVSTGGPVGYKETVTTPYITGDFIVPKDFPVTKLMEGTAMTVTAECANGMIYTLSDAYAVSDTAFKPMDGAVTIKFEGTNGELA